MLQAYRKLYELLTPPERRGAFYVLILMLIIAVFETLGVASIIPFIAVLSNPEVIDSNQYLALAYAYGDFDSREQFLFWLGVAVLVVLLSSLAFRAIGVRLQLRFTYRRNHSLARRMVARYLSQPFSWFLDRHSADTGNSVLGEVAQVVNDALFPAMQIIAQGFVAVALLTLLVLIDPVLALVIGLVLGGGYAALFLGFRRHLSHLGEERRIQNIARFRAVQEAFGGIKDVKVAGLEHTLVERFSLPSARLIDINTSQGILAQLPAYAMQGIIYGGMMLVLLYLMSSHGNFQQALPIIAVYAFAGYRLMPTLQMLYAQITRLRFATPVLDSFYHNFNSLDDIPIPDVEPAPLPIRESLELEHITFRYPGTERDAVSDVNLTIPVHTTVGLVGSTGSGKTTTVDIILGLLAPQGGCLKVDGVALRAPDLRSWQRTLGYVPQQIYLTDDSIAANIAFGMAPDAIDMAAVEKAARIANLHDFVVRDLPDGYRTEVGERGIRLSGGQRQRIGIARALYHEPDVIILDEATSALDNLTERVVMEAVHTLTHKKTIILIAHRLSTVRDCDAIHVLEHGRVVASGRYDDLASENALFRAMVTGGA